MNILFLDFDGVLNSKLHFLMQKEMPKVPGADTLVDADLFRMKRDVNKNNMWALKYVLTNVPDLKIVISSAWRNFYDMESFKELFEMFDMDGKRIIGKTPKKFSSERIHEIHEYLDEHKGITKWLALDDHVIFNLGDCDKVNEVLTDSWVGLTMPDAVKIIKHFKPDFKEPEILI